MIAVTGKSVVNFHFLTLESINKQFEFDLFFNYKVTSGIHDVYKRRQIIFFLFVQSQFSPAQTDFHLFSIHKKIHNLNKE